MFEREDKCIFQIKDSPCFKEDIAFYGRLLNRCFRDC